MLVSKFISTKIKPAELNSFLADLLETLIITSAGEKDNSPLMVLLEIENFGKAYCFMDDFIKLPLGDDGDKLYVKYENMVHNALLKILKEQEDLIELISENYLLNNQFQIFGLKQGIWVQIHA